MLNFLSTIKFVLAVLIAIFVINYAIDSVRRQMNGGVKK